MKKNASKKPALLFLIFFWIFVSVILTRSVVIPAKAGIQNLLDMLDSRFRGNDNVGIQPGPHTFSEKILLGLPFSIRTLSQKDWELLPNIGPVLAQRIVLHQQKNGPFASFKSLDDVSGIGPKTLESLRPFFRGAMSSF